MVAVILPSLGMMRPAVFISTTGSEDSVKDCDHPCSGTSRKIIYRELIPFTMNAD